MSSNNVKYIAVLLMLFPASAYADGGVISVPTALLIMAIGAILGVVLNKLWDWIVDELPTIPVCTKLDFTSAKQEGSDRICTYKSGDNEIKVSLNALKEIDPKIQGCPTSIHPTNG